MLLNLMWENSFNKKNRNSLFSFFNIILLEKIKKKFTGTVFEKQNKQCN